MKKTLVGVSLLAVFLIMMLPTVAAQEAKITQSSIRSPAFLSVQTAELEALKTKYQNDPQPQLIIITFLIMLLKLIRLVGILGMGIIILIVLRILGNQNNTTGLAC